MTVTKKTKFTPTCFIFINDFPEFWPVPNKVCKYRLFQAGFDTKYKGSDHTVDSRYSNQRLFKVHKFFFVI